MSRQPLRHVLILLRNLHPLPHLDRLLRIITTLRHHHQANIIRFTLLFPRSRSREPKVHSHISQYSAKPHCVACAVKEDEEEAERCEHNHAAHTF